jgi:hypothetical protein
VKNPESNMLESLGTLSVNDTQLYIVDWDTTVAIDDNVRASEPKQPTVKNFSFLLHMFDLSDNPDRASSMPGFRNNPRAQMLMRPSVV